MVPGDIQKNVVIGVRTDGEGLAEKLAAELQNAYGKLANLQNEIGSGARTVGESTKEYRALQSQIAFLERQLKSTADALRAADPEWVAYQARLKQMAEDSRRAAAEAAERAREEVTSGAMAVRQRVEQIRQQEQAEAATSRERDRQAAATAKLEGQMTAFYRGQARDADQAARANEAAARATSNAWHNAFAESGINQARATARATQDAIRSANELIGSMTIQRGEHAALLQAEQADAIAKRQMANAAAGAAREQAFLNDVIRVGIGEMMTEATAARQVTTAAGGAAGAIAGVGGVAGRSATRMGGLSVAVLAGANAFQDAASQSHDFGRALGSVANNIPLFVTGLAQAGGMATSTAIALGGGLMVATAGASALMMNWDKIKDAFGVGIPRPVIDTTGELERELKGASKEFESLSQKARLTLPELERYRELSEKIATLEKERQANKTDERLRGLKSEEEQKAGSGFERAVAESGGLDAVASQLRQALYNIATQTGQEFTLEGIANQADQMIRDAAGGDKKVRNDIRRAVSRFLPEGADGKLARNIWKYSPEGEDDARAREKAREEADRAIEADARDRADEANRLKDEGARNQITAGENAARKRDADVRSAAGSFAGQMDDPLIRAGLEGVAKGQAQDVVRKELRAQIETSLKAAGADRPDDAKFLGDVATQVLDRVMQAIGAKVAARVAQNAGDGPAGPAALTGQQAARSLVSEIDATAARKGELAGRRQDRAADVARRQDIGRRMQADYGLTDDQAAAVAPQVDALIRKGMNPVAAGQAVMARLHQFFQAQQQTIDTVQANQEAMMGFFGPAFQGIAAQQARAAQMQQNISRAAGRMRFNLLPTFSPFGG